MSVGIDVGLHHRTRIPLLLQTQHLRNLLGAKASVLLHPSRDQQNEDAQFNRIVQHADSIVNGAAPHQCIGENNALHGIRGTRALLRFATAEHYRVDMP